ncbi:MAG TPA: alpha/beta fold hydrolase [Ktedonobacteraceae bacterium]|nr:alpha/beta fold hydrolase [Ktedonobacteraceae bacterium]
MKARINGIELAYDDHGIGMPVIFLHAFPLNRTMWTGVTTALLADQRYRLVALDWRGFGESELGDTISSMELLADDLAALMDRLGMQAAVLCGLSMGGYVAFAFLRKYPQRVSGLILADTKPAADSEEARVAREDVARLAETQGPGAIADLQIPRLLAEQTRQQRPEVEIHVRRMIDAATPPGIAAASRGMAQRQDATALLATIQCPTLVIVGERDMLTPPGVAREYASQIAEARFAIIPRAGHLSNLEQPERFLEEVRIFLNS